MSDITVKPKVFRRPQDAPEEPKRFAFQSFAQGFEYQHYAYVMAGCMALLLLVLGQSFVLSGVPVKNSTASKKEFTFFAPSNAGSESSNQPFVINDKNETIVGQITEMAPEKRDFGNIQATTEVDSTATKDLLSVVNKY